MKESPATGSIFNIQRFSVSDGPGIRTTVFFKGCPLACAWCHNPESQHRRPEITYRRRRCMSCGACAENCPEQAITMGNGATTDLDTCTRCGTCLAYCFTEAREIVGQRRTCADVMQIIEKDRSFYEESKGGVTLSGGEPLMQAHFAGAVLAECKKRGIHTALDTCGYAEWATIDGLRSFVDLFLFDLKIMDDRQHFDYAGVSNRLILDNLDKLAHAGHHIIIRFPIIPGITDKRENIEAIAALAKALPNIIQIDILPYHDIAMEKYGRLQKDYSLGHCHPPNREEMMAVKSMMRKANMQVSIGG